MCSDGIIHVPPGYGKPTTHSRNNRRRKKRVHEKEQATAPPPTLKGASDANTVPLGGGKPVPAPSGASATATPLPPSPAAAATGSSQTVRDPNTPVYITQEQVMMGTLRNKNKKKGFKLSMASPIPQKIVFGATPADTVPLTTASMTSSLVGEPQTPARPQAAVAIPKATPSGTLFNATPAGRYVRLVPPSEIQAMYPERIPANMLITSVDVEAGMWDLGENGVQKGDVPTGAGGGKKKRGKKKGRPQAVYHDQGEWAEEETGWEGEEKYDARDDNGAGSALLDYGQSEEGGAFDWARADTRWDTHSTVITGPEQLVKGALVGWKVSFSLFTMPSCYVSSRQTRCLPHLVCLECLFSVCS